MAQQRKRSKKWLYWGLFLVLLVVAGVVVFLVWNNYFRDKKDEGGQQATAGQVEEKKEEDAAAVVEKTDVESGEVEEKKVKQYEGEDPNLAEELTGVVTYAGVNGGKLMIRVNIDQYLTEGSCELTLVREGAGVYVGTANVVGSPTTSSCDGFDVPVAGLDAGNYGIEIKINSGGKTGVIKGETKI